MRYLLRLRLLAALLRLCAVGAVDTEPIYALNIYPPKEVLNPVMLRTVPILDDNICRYTSGFKAFDNELPFVVALNFLGRYVSQWFCVGSIIANRWIVTAASCTQSSRLVKISYGASDRKQPEYVMRVSKRCFYAHPQYDRFYQNDIALIQTPYVAYTRTVQPIRLPTNMSHTLTFSRLTAYVPGWGDHEVNEIVTERLHITEMTVMDNDECVAAGYELYFNATTMMCGLAANREYTCRIDSGSPLVLKKNPMLVGVGSLSNQKGCSSHTPVIFTRLSAYVDWIDSITGRRI